MRFYKRFFLVFAIGIILFFLIGEAILPEDTPEKKQTAKKAPFEWMIKSETGDSIPLSDKLIKHAKSDSNIECVATLPDDLKDDYYLCFRVSRQDVSIFIDGQLRDSYQKKSTSLLGNNGSYLLYLVPVNSKDSNKDITLKTELIYKNAGIFHNIYYGSYLNIWIHYFKESGAEVIISFVTLLLGILTILGSYYAAYKYAVAENLIYAGWIIVLTSIWIIGNSQLRQLLVPNLAIANDMSFYMIMLLPFPAVIFMDIIQEGRYKRRYQITCFLAALNLFLSILLNVTGVCEYAASFPSAAFVIFVMVISLFSAMIQDIINNHIKDYFILAIGFLGAIITSIIQIVLYLTNFAYMSSNVLMDIGIWLILLSALINTVRRILVSEQKKRLALSMSEAKSEFFAHISHEIRTPINAIIGMNHMILQESNQEPILEYATDIENAGNHLIGLVNNILDFSRLDSGKISLHPTEYDLTKLVRNVTNIIRPKAIEKKLKLEINMEETLPSKLYGDDLRIQQILINLLSNAVKYTKTGFVQLAITGKTMQDTITLRVVVKDSGIGIKPEQLKQLFSEYERIEEEQNRNIEGTGLGMSITTRLLQLMDSSIQVNSVYGEGSEFYFDLTQKIVDATPIGNLKKVKSKLIKEENKTSLYAPNATILVVDDTIVNLKLFAGLLKKTHIQVDTAESGYECLDILTKKEYDIVFLDHMMPELNGIETLKKVKELESFQANPKPVVALTANADVDAKEYYISQGFDEFLSKPVNPEILEELIRNLLPAELVE